MVSCSPPAKTYLMQPTSTNHTVARHRSASISAATPGRNTGFTLVELLVVIGITATLIAMLLPALQRARASSASVTCAANLRQVATALTLYETNHGQYPLMRDPSLGAVSPAFAASSVLPKTWVDTLVEGRYLTTVDLSRGDLGVLRCPTADHFEIDPSWLSYTPHYGYNNFINPATADAPRLGDRSFQGRRALIRADVSRTILLADSRHPDATRGWHSIGNHRWVHLRHNGNTTANVAFVAGNVESVRPRQPAPATAADPTHPFSSVYFERRSR